MFSGVFIYQEMDSITYKLSTLYFYKDDLLGCNVLRHKYSHHPPLSLLIRDFGNEQIDITLNNVEYIVHPNDQEKAKIILNSK